MLKRLARNGTGAVLAFAMLAILLLPSSLATVETIDAHMTQAHLPVDDYGTIVIRVDNPGNEALNVTHIVLRVYQSSIISTSNFTEYVIFDGARRIAAGSSSNFSYMMLAPYGAGKYSSVITTTVHLDSGTNLAVPSAADLYVDRPIVWPETLGVGVFFVLVFALCSAVAAIIVFILYEKSKRASLSAQTKGTPFWESTPKIIVAVVLAVAAGLLIAAAMTGIVFHWF
jgi:hypothetical protein